MSNRKDPLGPWSVLAGWILASSIGWAAGMMLTLMADEYNGLNTYRFLA